MWDRGRSGPIKLWQPQATKLPGLQSALSTAPRTASAPAATSRRASTTENVPPPTPSSPLLLLTRADTSDLLLIRDVVEELQSNEREFHRSQQARYECLKRTIIEMESRWTKEKHKRSMARVRRERRALEERLRLTEMGRCVVTPVRDSGLCECFSLLALCGVVLIGGGGSSAVDA